MPRVDPSSVSSPRFCKKSGSKCEELGEVEVADLDRRRHEAAPQAGRTPPPGAGHLGHQAVDVETVEEATDLCTVALGVVGGRGAQQRRVGETIPEVTVGEAAQMVCAIEDGLEDL